MSAAADPDTRTRRLVWSALAAVLVGVIALGAWRLWRGAPSVPPVFGVVPPFTLTERSGAAVSAVDLAGRVWIADFVFTRCGGICPALSAQLAALLERLRARGITDVTAVSFTVDPERDDPATLARYAERFGADPTRWLFLTGERAAIEQLIRDGFRLSVAEVPPEERATAVEPITHSDRFVLVDGQLRIRGYYHGTDAREVADLERDLAALLGARS